MENNIKETLQGLITAHGPEKVQSIAQVLLNTTGKEITVEAGETFAGVLDYIAKGAANFTVATGNMLEAARINAAPKMPTMIPPQYNSIQPHNLDYVNDQLEGAAVAVQIAGAALSKAHEGRAELYKAVAQLRTQAKLEESEAIMSWGYEGGKPYAMVDGQKVPMSNDTVRDAFRRTASKDTRKLIAEKEAEIQALDIALAKAQDEYGTAVETQKGITRKAEKQTALLNFLARG